MHTVKQVYVAGGMPVLSYVDRKVSDKRQELLDAIDSHKLITVTGNTKTGKTVLVNKMFPKDKHIWVDSGTVNNESEFWEFIHESLQLWDSIEKTTEYGGELAVAGTASAQAGIILAKATTEISGSISGNLSKGSLKGRSVNKKVSTLVELGKNNKCLIIDDFHYLDKQLQQTIVRALKGLIFNGLNVICIAIPHRKYDAIMVEREMNGRVVHIDIPVWEDYELVEIAKSGESPLRIKYREEVLTMLSTEAFGSPHLMQEFLILLLNDLGIHETQQDTYFVEKCDDAVFTKIAEQTGNEVFRKLAIGPRARSDRKERRLKDGKVVDIYKLVLLTLIELKPGMIRVNYVPEIRNAMKKLIDELPQVNEVSRNFEKMKEIALSDNSSVAVLEWNKSERELIITDPFFALYLKHGKLA